MIENLPASRDIDLKLRAAADRLLSRWHEDSSAKITRAALVRESGVSKATLYRRTDFLAQWESDVAEAIGYQKGAPEEPTIESFKALEAENATLKAALVEARAERRNAQHELKTAISIIVGLSRQKPRAVR